jgi:hypothetical protein
VSHPNNTSLAEQAKALISDTDPRNTAGIAPAMAQALATLELARQMGRVADAMDRQAAAQHRIVDAIRKRI